VDVGEHDRDGLPGDADAHDHAGRAASRKVHDARRQQGESAEDADSVGIRARLEHCRCVLGQRPAEVFGHRRRQFHDPEQVGLRSSDETLDGRVVRIADLDIRHHYAQRSLRSL
jgi:hypothetical protein